MALKKRSITAEDLYKIKLVSEARISPDGRHVVFVVQRVDQKTEKKYANLWVAPITRGTARQYTFGDQNDTSPEWSPDGTQIAFLSNRGDKEKPAQIYLLPFHGGEARPLTDIKGVFGEFSWSPDGSQLLCTVRKTDTDALEREQDERKKKLGIVSRHYERLYFKLDGTGYLPKEQFHIWTINARTGRGTQLTDHHLYTEFNPDWSPDGKRIVFASNRSENPDFTREEIDLYMMPAQGGEFRKIEAPIGRKSLPVFSPDGKWIGYFGQEGQSQWYKNVGLWVVPLDGSAPPKNLTEKYDLHCAAETLSDQGNAEQMAPIWSTDSKTITFQTDIHGSTCLKSIDIGGENLQTLTEAKKVVGSVTFDKNANKMAYFQAKMDSPGRIWVRDLRTGRDKMLSKQNSRLFGEIDLGHVEEIWFKGGAGNDLQGWIIKPSSFDPNKKYPSILEIHGGPIMQYGSFFMHEFFYLASKGYVVYFCNPRGGRGYGEAHAKAIWGNWGDADYADLMAFTDEIEKLPYIDTERMGVTGGSYGGYMTLWIIGHTRRFTAAVAQRVVSNFISMWGSSDYNWVFQQVLGNGKQAPFDNIDKFWNHSPMKYIGNAQTPTLIIHSEFDLRCPIEQGEQAFTALKRLGVDSEMVRFPDEPHGLSRVGRTDRRIVRLNHIVRWMDKYLNK